MKLIKKNELLGLIAKSNTTLYSDISLGMFTKSIQIGENAVAWPLYEVNAINTARIAGKNADEIKQLVNDLMELRKVVAGKTEVEIQALVAALFKD
jgi:prophage regulatory protein